MNDIRYDEDMEKLAISTQKEFLEMRKEFATMREGFLTMDKKLDEKFSTLQKDMKQGFADVRVELHSEIGLLRSEVRGIFFESRNTAH